MRLSMLIVSVLVIEASSVLNGCDNDLLTEGVAVYTFGVKGAVDRGEDEEDGSAMNGSWADSDTNLEWQLTPSGGRMTWEEARNHCSGLGLDGGGWRLPDIGELRSLIRGCPGAQLGSDKCEVEPGGCMDESCVNGELCKACSSYEGPDKGCYWPSEMDGECSWYWSSSVVVGANDAYWYVFFTGGGVANADNGSFVNVRCVR